MRHPPPPELSEIVDKALARVERAAERERLRRISSRPGAKSSPPQAEGRSDQGDDDETLEVPIIKAPEASDEET